MSRIAASFAKLKSEGRKAYVGYVMASFPSQQGAQALAQGLLEAGADAIEIGVPFSDPIADGPVIQRCGELAIAKGGGLKSALELAKQLRSGSDKPLLLMSYLNPALSLGPAGFAAALADAGVDGTVIPDLTPEEAAPWQKALSAKGLDLIFLAAPTSTPARLKRIAAKASGFIYMVSVAGVTGERQAFDQRLSAALAELAKASPLPVCVGFGISSPESAQEAAKNASGVVVASTVLKGLIDEGDAGLPAALEKARVLIQAVKA